MKKIMLGVGAFLVAFAVGAGVATYRDAPPAEVLETASPPTTFPGLTVGLARSGNRLVVTNAGEDRWTSCMIDLNAGVPGGGFSARITDVAAGADATVLWHNSRLVRGIERATFEAIVRLDDRDRGDDDAAAGDD